MKTSKEAESRTLIADGDEARLFPTEHNPVPAGLRAFHVTTPDGIRLRAAVSRTTAASVKGTVIILQGRNECIEKYFETIGELSENGFDIVAFDWRGQGDSARLIADRMRGYVRSFEGYRTDLERIITHVAMPDCRGPFFILAHSAGALITLHTLPRLGSRIDRIVLCAPFLALRVKSLSTTTVGMMGRLLTWIGLGKVYMAGGPRPKGGRPFEGNAVTSDPVRFARNAKIYDVHGHLALGGPTARWVASAVSAMNLVKRRASRLHWLSGEKANRVPTLVITAGADTVVDTSVAEDVAQLLPGAYTLRIDGARHEILQEHDRYRRQAMAAILAFLPGTDPYLRPIASEAEAGQTPERIETADA